MENFISKYRKRYSRESVFNCNYVANIKNITTFELYHSHSVLFI
jgi:hypothetical protein